MLLRLRSRVGAGSRQFCAGFFVELGRVVVIIMLGQELVDRADQQAAGILGEFVARLVRLMGFDEQDR